MFDTRGVSAGVPLGMSMPAPPPNEVGNVTVEGRVMEKATDELHVYLSELEARLGMVLLPESTDATSGPATPTPLRSNFADGMAEANRRIQSATLRVQRMVRRLDL